MKKDLTEIVVVLDESGSMSSCKLDTIGGFNEFINTQKKIKGSANVTFVKFSDYYQIINNGTPIEHVAALNESNYTPSNTTALLDAVGKTIDKIGERLLGIQESERPEKILFVIITDGHENASRTFSRHQVFEMITHQREKYNWEFLFLGADIDAWGKEIGISSNSTVSKDDMSRSFKGLSYYTANYRTDNVMSVSDFNLSSTELDNKIDELTQK